MVDGQPATKATMRLPAGPHEIAISAPRYEFYVDTVQVPREDLLELSPSLVPIGAALGGAKPDRTALSQAVRNCEVPGPANRFGRDCYDEPPRPRSPTRLAGPGGLDRHALGPDLHRQGLGRWEDPQRPGQDAVE